MKGLFKNERDYLWTKDKNEYDSCAELGAKKSQEILDIRPSIRQYQQAAQVTKISKNYENVCRMYFWKYFFNEHLGSTYTVE
jgi:hypothetical protein